MAASSAALPSSRSRFVPCALEGRESLAELGRGTASSTPRRAWSGGGPGAEDHDGGAPGPEANCGMRMLCSEVASADKRSARLLSIVTPSGSIRAGSCREI